MFTLALRRLLVALCLALTLAACKESKPAVEGHFLGLDGALLITIERGRRVLFRAPVGEDACVELGEGELRKKTLRVPGGEPLRWSFAGTTLVLDDPEGYLSGSYEPVFGESICAVGVPEPGPIAEGVVRLTPEPPRALADGSVARSARFEVGAEVGTLAIYVMGPYVGYGGIELLSLRHPTGEDLLATEPYLAECMIAYCAVLLPKIPGYEPVAGRYELELGGYGDIEDLHLFVVTRALPIADTRVRVHPVVGPTDVPEGVIEEALLEVVDFLGGFGIELVLDPLTRADDPMLASVPAMHLSARTQRFFALGEPDALNVLFADDLTGIEGLYGIASGIPGSLGVVGPWNGVLVNLSMHEDDGRPSLVEALRETITHELGHLLGLYHTTESRGALFDPLADTPMCDVETFDVDDNGYVLADECASAGGDNVMFWTPSVSAPPPISQVVLTDDQRYVLEHVVVGY